MIHLIAARNIGYMGVNVNKDEIEKRLICIESELFKLINYVEKMNERFSMQLRCDHFYEYQEISIPEPGTWAYMCKCGLIQPRSPINY